MDFQKKLQHLYTREVDNIGRIVLPSELRRVLQLAEGDAVDFYLEDNDQFILLAKRTPSCCCCGGIKGLVALSNGKSICTECVALIDAVEVHT